LKNIGSSFEIASLLREYANRKHFSQMVEVVEHKINLIDVKGLAVSWFQSGRLANDIEGRRLFDSRYKIYLILFEYCDDSSA
jgi:hypothetical protein